MLKPNLSPVFVWEDVWESVWIPSSACEYGTNDGPVKKVLANTRPCPPPQPLRPSSPLSPFLDDSPMFTWDVISSFHSREESQPCSPGCRWICTYAYPAHRWETSLTRTLTPRTLARSHPTTPESSDKDSMQIIEGPMGHSEVTHQAHIVSSPYVLYLSILPTYPLCRMNKDSYPTRRPKTGRVAMLL